MNIKGNLQILGQTFLGRFTTVQRDLLTDMVEGSLIWNSTTDKANIYSGTTWTTVGGSGIPAWLTATAYAIGDTVTTEGRIYRAVTAGTSTTFNADRASWSVLATIPAGSNWTASTYYYADDVVVESNKLLRRNTSGTSGLTFDVTEQLEWTALTASNETSWRLPVAATGIVANAGTSIVGQASFSLDGVPLVDGMFILLQGETTSPATYFGRVFEVGGVGAAITLTLRPDGQLGTGAPTEGDFITVAQGTASADTTWRYTGTEWVTALGLPPYTQTFNATTDWGVASGGLFTITIPAATHLMGTSVTQVSHFESSGGLWEEVGVNSVTIDQTSGDVSFTVSEVPDLRFAGRVTLDAGLGGTSQSSGGGTNILTANQTQTADRVHQTGQFGQRFEDMIEPWVWTHPFGGNRFVSIDPNTLLVRDPETNVENRISASQARIANSFNGRSVTQSLPQSLGEAYWTMDDGVDRWSIHNFQGTPQGAVFASRGSLCVDTTNSLLYIKTTDIVNTGWVLVGAAGGTNLFTGDQIQTATRTHTQGGFTQNINGAGQWVFTGTGTNDIRLDTDGNQISIGDGTFAGYLEPSRVFVQNATDTAAVEMQSIGSTDVDVAFYWGAEAVDGSWRMVRVGANLETQLRVTGVWTVKAVVTP